MDYHFVVRPLVLDPLCIVRVGVAFDASKANGLERCRRDCHVRLLILTLWPLLRNSSVNVVYNKRYYSICKLFQRNCNHIVNSRHFCLHFVSSHL